MNIATAFLADVKKRKWSVCTVEKGKSFRVGDTFSVVGKEGHVSKVVVSSGSKEDRVLLPIKGTLEIESTEQNELTFGFKYKTASGSVEQFFMRFHFFKVDPTVFRFSSNPFRDDDCEPKCECCCCGVSGGYVLYSTYDDGDRGTGGPH